MSQLRLDPLTGRWVVITAIRGERPNAFLERTIPYGDADRRCPFCPGHEEDTPDPVKVYENDGEWLVRVVPNLYPAFTGREPMAVNNLGPVYMEAPASGSHEVLIFSPEHKDGWADLSKEHLSLVMKAIAERMTSHGLDPGLRYSQLIVNFGREAGASVEHPHAQLLSMPFVPRELMEEQNGFARFRGNCIMCATVESEEWAELRLVYHDADVMIFCPYWSGTAYEMMIVPKSHEAHLANTSAEVLDAIGAAVQKALQCLREAVGDVAYNLVCHTAPLRSASDFHWHIHLLPKVTTPAGFELGTGVPINVVAPETAAAELRATTAS